MLKNLWCRYRRWILYGIFGVLTTMVNFSAYFICYQIFRWANVPSTLIAWLFAVSFAFFTNKVWVFESRHFTSRLVLQEGVRFFSSRAMTGGMDIAIMYIGVDVLAGPALAWKIGSDIIATILNYVASRFWAFRTVENYRGMN